MQHTNETNRIQYHVGNTTFIVTPVYNTAQGEALAVILLKLMKADVQRV